MNPNKKKNVWKSKSRYRGGNLHFLRPLRFLWTSQTFLRTQTSSYLKLLHQQAIQFLCGGSFLNFVQKFHWPLSIAWVWANSKTQNAIEENTRVVCSENKFFHINFCFTRYLPTTSHYTKIIFFILYNAIDNTGVHIIRILVQRKHVSLFKQSNKHKTRLLFIEVINHSHLNIKNTTVMTTKLQQLLNKEPVTKFTYVLLTLKYTFCRTHWRS